jgi:general transcription factor 3C polypeptide 6
MEEDWEEEVIFVEFGGLVDQQWPGMLGQKCKIVGIDSDQPVLQFGPNIFTGSYSDSLGSKVMFELQSSHSDQATNEQDQPDSLKYLCCTDKILSMQRVFTSKKESDRPIPPESMDVSDRARNSVDILSSGTTDLPPPAEIPCSVTSDVVLHMLRSEDLPSEAVT